MFGSIYSLSRHTPANEIRSILREHFACIRLQRADAFSDSTQGRRELRNSARKLLYAIEYFKPLVDYEHFDKAQGSLGVMIQALGEICDEEIFIKSLTKIEPEAPLGLLVGIKRLIEERKSYLASLVDNLASLCDPTFQFLEATFLTGLDALQLILGESVTLNQIACQIISGCLDDMTSASTALYRPSKTRTSHRLRISLRKLRYALALFSSYSETDLRALSTELNALHITLGKLRDCDLKLNTLGDWLTEHHAQIHTRADMTSEWQAAVWLMADIFEGRPKRYRNALAAGQDLLASAFASRVANALVLPSVVEEVRTQIADSSRLAIRTNQELRT